MVRDSYANLETHPINVLLTPTLVLLISEKLDRLELADQL